MVLALLTLVTTTLAGAEWRHGNVFIYGPKPLGFEQFLDGLAFSLPLLLFLTTHEMGHYLMAVRYKVQVSWPFYIPMWLGFIPGGILTGIGTLGAFIQLRSRPITTRQYFDIGIAGPLAGFVVALVLLTIGFTTLPPIDYVFSIHPEFAQWGADFTKYAYEQPNLRIGDNLIMLFFKEYVADPARVPNGYEIAHYPMIFAGYVGLLVTSINLLPFGQLDGGHVMYGLLGAERCQTLKYYMLHVAVFLAGLGQTSVILDAGPEAGMSLFNNLLLLGVYYIMFQKLWGTRDQALASALGIFAIQYALAYFYPTLVGFNTYMLFLLIVARFLGLDHPRAAIEQELDTKRKVLGILSLVIFILCFTPYPFEIVAGQP